MRFQFAAEQLTKSAKRFDPFLSVFYAFYPFFKRFIRSLSVLRSGNDANIRRAVVRAFGPPNLFVVFIIHERTKGRMYARVRSDLSGVIRKALETVERGLVNHVAFAGYDGRVKIL